MKGHYMQQFPQSREYIKSSLFPLSNSWRIWKNINPKKLDMPCRCLASFAAECRKCAVADEHAASFKVLYRLPLKQLSCVCWNRAKYPIISFLLSQCKNSQRWDCPSLFQFPNKMTAKRYISGLQITAWADHFKNNKMFGGRNPSKNEANRDPRNALAATVYTESKDPLASCSCLLTYLSILEVRASAVHKITVKLNASPS